MTVADVRTELAAACRTVSGLRAAEYVPDEINPPVAVISLGDVDPRMVMGQGKAARNFVVSILAGRTNELAAQKLLDTYTELSGSTSVLAAIETSSALNGGGTADYAQVTNVSGLKVATYGTTDYLAIDFDVEVCF